MNTARRDMGLLSAAITDQVILSGANFLVGFILIRFATDQSYAVYVLVQSALLLLMSMHNSYLMGPLAVLTPRLQPEERRGQIGAVKRVQRRFLSMVSLPLLAVPLLGYLLGFLDALMASVVAMAIIAGWVALRREYLRSVLLMYSRPNSLLGADAIYAGLLLAGVGCAVLAGPRIIVAAVFALAVAGWGGAAAAHRSLAKSPGWSENAAVTLWPEIRRLGFWSLTGSTVYWFLGQSYSYLLVTRLDLIAVADVNATRLLLMPAIVMTIGVASLLGPMAANWYAQMGLHRMVQRLLVLLIAVGILEGCYFAGVWFAREWLVSNVLHKQIHDRDWLLLLWAGVALIALVRDVMQCALVAMGRLKSLAGQVAVSAAVAVLLMWFGLDWWGAPAVLIGQIVGELINLTGIVLLLRKLMREETPQALAAESP